MKFAWKVFFSTLLLVALAFSVGGSLLIASVYDTALQREMELAEDENQVLRFSFLTAAGGITGELTDGRARRMAQAIQDSGAYSFRLSDEAGASLYATAGYSYAPLSLDGLSPQARVWQLQLQDGVRFVQTSCFVSSGGRTFTLESVRDVSYLFAQRDAALDQFRWLTAGVLLVSAAVMFALAQYLTRPIRRLADVTCRFADGDYQLRAPVLAQDEIGSLTRDFNAMADRLEHKILELEDASRRQEDFIASFAHELKTPLTAVIGYADLLRSQKLTEEQQFRAASYIFTEGQRLEALSLKLLDLIVVRRTDFPLRPVHMSALARQAESALRPGFEAAGISLELDLAPAAVPAEAGLLTTLLLNLCDNARKASTPGGAVRVTGVWDGGDYVLSVRDEGAGMAPEVLRRVTEPFYMADKSRARAQNGAGLGLALCAAIAEVHGSQLELESAPGQGTTALLRLKGGEAE